MPRISTAFHIGALAQHIYTLNSLLHWPVPLPEPVPTSWHFQYLTTLALSLSTISFSLACLTHLIAYLTKPEPQTPPSRLLHLACNIHETISPVAAAAEILVTTLYFGIKAISTDLVIPDWAMLPLTLDLNLHLIPTVLRLGDALLFSPRGRWQAVSVRRAGGVSLAAAVAYWVLCERSKASSGMYPYPVMEEVGGVAGRLVLFAVSAGLLMGNLLGLKWVYGVVHGSGGAAKGD